jgi:hypothetical protein
MHHELKIEVAYFEATVKKKKQFEIRYNDRGFNAGDTVTLFEIEGGFRTGRSYTCEIIYVTNFGQKPDWVVFGHKPIKRISA